MVVYIFGMSRLAKSNAKSLSTGKDIICLLEFETKADPSSELIDIYSSVVCGVSWNPAGDFLYSAEKNKTVCMWNSSSTAHSSSASDEKEA